MTDKKLLKYVTGFRKGILSGKSPDGQCYAVCAPLSSLLGIYGQKNGLANCDLFFGDDTYDHYVIELSDGRIMDPTASQFNHLSKVIMPDVYIGKRPEWYENYISLF